MRITRISYWLLNAVPFLIILYNSVCVCVCTHAYMSAYVHTYYSVHIENRKQRAGIIKNESQRSNSDCQAMQQALDPLSNLSPL